MTSRSWFLIGVLVGIILGVGALVCSVLYGQHVMRVQMEMRLKMLPVIPI